MTPLYFIGAAIMLAVWFLWAMVELVGVIIEVLYAKYKVFDAWFTKKLGWFFSPKRYN